MWRFCTTVESSRDKRTMSEKSSLLENHKWIQRTKGTVLAFLSAVLFTINDFLIQQERIDYIDMLAIRSLVNVVILGFIIFKIGYGLWPKNGDVKTKAAIIVQGEILIKDKEEECVVWLFLVS